MKLPITNRRRFILQSAGITLLLFVLGTLTTQRIVAGGLIGLAQITERIVHYPCGAVDHCRCFSLDRLDPTCPQCL
jgi:hypothetical protein